MLLIMIDKNINFKEHFAIQEIFKKKLVEINSDHCVSELKKKFFNESNQEIKLNLYIELTRKINDLIGKIKKLIYSHNVNISL